MAGKRRNPPKRKPSARSSRRVSKSKSAVRNRYYIGGEMY